MHLAKDRIDVGLMTNRLEAMLAFWQNEVGLPLDHVLPLGNGLQQHRHDMRGSVLKINHTGAEPPATPPAGYRELLIAREGLTAPKSLRDPDGNRVTLLPPGERGVARIGVVVGVRDLAAHRQFYSEAMGLTALASEPAAFLCGDSIIHIEPDASAPRAAELGGGGYRYLTVQVWSVDKEHAGILARGGAEGRAPETLGQVARISFVRDPDGNWIEISQRASLTGSLEVKPAD